MLTASKVFKEIQATAEAVRNDETAKVGTVSLGDVIRQGDLYLVAIGKLPPKLTPLADRQLAPGTTQGSRHVLQGKCDLYEADKKQVAELIRQANGTVQPEPLIGPVFRTLAPCELEHPEHGNRILPAGECFAVVYQRQHAEEIRRVLD